MRILLIDDHPVVRQGLRFIVTDRWTDAMVGEADSAMTGLQQVQRQGWDVVVLDLSLGSDSGLDLLKVLHKRYPALPVLVLSMHPASQFARRVLSAGALGYLTKGTDANHLVDAITHVRGRRSYVHPPTPDVPALQSPDRVVQAHEALSDREFQVFRMLGGGRTVSQIATSLGLSVKTISTYRARVLDKLGMTTNAELMRYAIENGVIEG